MDTSQKPSVSSMSRVALAMAALFLTLGALMHASAFSRISQAVASSNLQPFAANSFKVLWLADSATSFLLAVVFACFALRSSAATRWVIILLAFIPFTTAALIYAFIGNFIGGHILLASAVAAFGSVISKRSIGP